MHNAGKRYSDLDGKKDGEDRHQQRAETESRKEGDQRCRKGCNNDYQYVQ